MATFPSIASPNKMSGGPVDPAIRSEMENGVVVSRAKHTKSRETFSLSWNVMSDSDFDTLLSFYKNTVKGSAETCTYTQPGTSTAYTVRITKMTYEAVLPDRWAVSLEMEEA